jgi:hypothetical protein
MAVVLATSASGATFETGALTAEVIDAELVSLSATEAAVSWLDAPTTLFTLDDTRVDGAISASALPDGQLLLTLELSNPESTDISVSVDFPVLSGLGTGATAALAYVFPARGVIADDAVATHRRYYGGLFPLQFMEIHEGSSGGLWVLTRDRTGQAKTYTLAKASDDTATLSVEWPSLVIPAGEAVELEASVGVHSRDWHEALAAYRRWVRTWFQPSVPRSTRFREAFNLRQLHLHENAVLGSHPGAFDPETGSYRIAEYIAEDEAVFGGVDWVHIFDWGMDWVHGRVGDYNPFAYLGDREALVAEVDALQADGIGVGLYLEGYLLDTTSLTGVRWGEDWELLDSTGSVYTHYAPSWHVCPATPAWQDHFAWRNGRRTERRVGADGLYLDQLGYGYQYPCHRADHDHAVPSSQVLEELALVSEVRRATSPSQVLYTEAAPADVMCQFQDGAFVEAVASFRYDERTVPISPTRFALPDFKTFELLIQDAPLEDDVAGVWLTFFNGEGIRLMGYLEDDDWFADETRAAIRHTWSILRDHRAAFTSDDPVPLVDTEYDDIYANLFPTDTERLWTLYNAGDSEVSGVVLSVDTLPGETWTDCREDAALDPTDVDGKAQVVLTLGPGEVGCVVQTLPASSPTLVAHWMLDETSGDVIADGIGAAEGTLWPEGAGPALGAASARTDRFGTAAWLDGADDSVSLGEVPALAALTEDFSVAAWVHPDEVDGVQRILAIEGWSDGGWVFGLTEWHGTGAVVLTTTGVKDYVLPVVVPPDRWTHLAVVVDAGSTATFYVDGNARGTISHSVPGIPATAGWWLGTNGTDGFFAGGLDDIRVYEGALSSTEVRALADIEPPMAGTIRGADSVLDEADEAELWWSGFHDSASGIAGYTVALGSSAGTDDLLATTEVGTEVQGVFTDLALPEGTIWATVVATDAVGLSTTASAEIQVDAAHPLLVDAWTFEPDEPTDSVAVSLDRDRQERFSLTAWIAPEAATEMTIFGSDNSGWRLDLTETGLSLVTHDVQDYETDVYVEIGAWTHVAVVFDRWSDVLFYVDGERVDTVHGSLPALPATDSLWVGGSASPWLGRLQDVRLYDGELSGDEVADIAWPSEDIDTGDTGRPDSGSPSGDSRDDADTGGDRPATDGPPKDGDCGCAATSLPSAAWILGALALVRRRRQTPR